MNDDHDGPPTGDQLETGRRRQATVAEAAAALGISVDAVRGRLQRGTLDGDKIQGVWQVHLPDDVPLEEPAGDQRATTGRRQDTPVDLSPLVDLIERQSRELQELRETATVWQFRAMQAEEQLKQLTAGEIRPESERTPDPDTTHEVGESPQSAESPSLGVIAWLRRLLSS